ncbi:hypothetical protein B005_3688 [Nocardiopsis alba ATCC BAA-2165]|uniref:Uncharacterized protein n=1 Tax=Nocardiopsis alba (strain ATCC BAA-2165 / BE74) TaxID=1205910 RepID=J7KZB8_NOCAA|nr:hypothetical protein B005_3688 [Nocardiopsis alba ATCC BAA-2165]
MENMVTTPRVLRDFVDRTYHVALEGSPLHGRREREST